MPTASDGAPPVRESSVVFVHLLRERGDGPRVERRIPSPLITCAALSTVVPISAGRRVDREDRCPASSDARGDQRQHRDERLA